MSWAACNYTLSILKFPAPLSLSIGIWSDFLLSYGSVITVKNKRYIHDKISTLKKVSKINGLGEENVIAMKLLENCYSGVLLYLYVLH